MHSEVNLNSLKKMLNQSLGKTFSPVIIQIIQATLQDDVEIEIVAKLVSLDPVLVATVLGIANSPHQGFSKKVTSIKSAITVLGLKEILRLAISISIKKNFSSETDTSEGVTADDWRMTIWAAVAAQHLALYLGYPKKEQAYLAALLKDIPLMLINSLSPLPQKEGKNLTKFEPSQLQTEMKTWGLTHPEMSQILADAWMLSGEMGDAMSLHHTPLINIPKDKPLALAVALGTKWSELIQINNTTAEGFFNFEIDLRLNLALSDDSSELEEIRLKILKDFKAALAQLGITEMPPEQRVYENSLSSLKNYYFLSLDLGEKAQDLPSMANALGNHLAMFWLIPSWDIALKLPHNNNYMFFTCKEGTITQSDPLPLKDWTQKNDKKRSFQFTIKTKHFGELLIPKKLLKDEKLPAFTTYLSFINQSLENYYTNRLKLITQASMLDDLPISVASFGLNGELINANKKFIDFFELDKSEDIPNIPKLINKKFNFTSNNSWANFSEHSEGVKVGELLSPHASASDQSPIYMETLRQFNASSPPQILMLIQSVSEISNLEAHTLRQLDFLQQLFGSMKDLILTINLEGKITWTPPALKSLEGKNFFTISRPANTDSEWTAKLLQNQNALLSPIEVGLKIEEARVGLFEFIFSPLVDNESIFLVVGRDLTNIRRLEATIRQQATRDGLTGLYNRSYFYELIKNKIDNPQEGQSDIGLLFMDLDNFKRINDNEGHLVGDEFLKQVAGILQRNLRKGYDHAARYGGDEFAILASKVTPELMGKIAQRLIGQVDKQSEGKVGLSVGIAMLEPGQNDTNDFLRRADRALYTAKACGGNCFSWGKK